MAAAAVAVMAPVAIPVQSKPECVICGGDVRTDESWNKLTCGHIHCDGCLRANFRISMRTLPFKPAQCCNRIPVSILRSALYPVLPASSTEVNLYRQLLAEYDANGDRLLYCWDPKCSAFIPPAMREGFRAAKCRKCHSKTCVRCHGKHHFGPCSETAPALSRARARRMGADPRSRAEIEQMKLAERERKRRENEMAFKRLMVEKRWRSCPACKRATEKTDGCNHIACICGCHWCYRCGKAPYGNHGRCAM